jgi:PIN domain nuclease of toxin-antitoxin system
VTRILIDAHGLIWFLEDSPRLSQRAKETVEHPDTDLLISMASLWEMAIKIGLGKLQIAGDFSMLLRGQLTQNDIRVLDIQLPHVAQVATLALHHRDPFDRLLVAQAIVEDMPIISADTALDAYPVTRIW